MFGLKKLKHDLYWLKKQVEDLERSLIQLKRDRYLIDNPPKFKAGDKVVYKYDTCSGYEEYSATIIKEDTPAGCPRKYWIDVVDIVDSVRENTLSYPKE